MNKYKVGILHYQSETSRFSFEYEPNWITNTFAFPISPTLPFQRALEQTDELHSVNVRHFFENLLPEGKALDDAALNHGVAKGNLFGLLHGLGQETAGGLSLLPEGIEPTQLSNSKRKIEFQELSKRIQDRANQPFAIWDGKVRMSIAGYQDKLAVYINEEQLFLVEGQLASTHILKPESTNPKLSNLVANEHFCMTLANAIGIASAAVSIIRVPEPVLVIERFDRNQQLDKVERLHIIDSCQVLNLGVNHKYERNFGSSRDVKHIRDGVSLEKLFSIAAMTQTEAATRMALLRWTLLQYLIGNSDAHGKNISFLVDAGGLQLAPAYDLVSVCLYHDIDHELAMALGDEFKINKVHAYDWADFAHRCGIERRLLIREINRITKDLNSKLKSVLSWTGYTNNEHDELKKICNFILKQAEQLINDSKFIVDVELT